MLPDYNKDIQGFGLVLTIVRIWPSTLNGAYHTTVDLIHCKFSHNGVSASHLRVNSLHKTSVTQFGPIVTILFMANNKSDLVNFECVLYLDLPH